MKHVRRIGAVALAAALSFGVVATTGSAAQADTSWDYIVGSN